MNAMQRISVREDEPDRLAPALDGTVKALGTVETIAPGDPLEDCLLYLLAAFDMPTSPASVRAGLAGTSQRMSVDQFTSAAERSGLSVISQRIDLRGLNPAVLPAIVLLNSGRAMVLVEQPDRQSFLAHAPGQTGLVRVAVEDIAPALGRDVLSVRRTQANARSAPGVEQAHRGASWFWQPLAKNWWTYAQVLLAAAMANVLGLTTSIFIMAVYDRVVPNQAIDSLVALTAGVAIALAFDFIIKTLRGVFIDRAAQRADLAMARTIFDHVLGMQLKARKGSVGGLASTLREFEVLREFFTSASLVALVDLPFVLLFIFVIAMIGGPLSVVPMIAVPAVLLVGVIVQPFLGRLAGDAFREGQNKHSVLVETLSGLETIKATGAAGVMRKRWEDSIDFQSRTSSRSRGVAQFALNATSFAQQAAQVGIVFYGVFLIQANVITMGAMIASVLLTGRALAPLGQLSQTMTRINQARTSFRALGQVMQAPSERMPGRRYLSRPRLNGSIELRGVEFRYPDQSDNALDGVSLKIAPGEKVALLGRIGSGKSTIVRLLLGLYEPDRGAVLVDQTDIRQLDPADLRSNIGCALQDIWLFSGTIRENIAAGMHRPTDEMILRAATIAGVHDFVSAHPLGYDQVLGERGEGLSGGQRQSVALARALVGDPPILILDEPTSMMDMQTEQVVLHRLGEAMQGRTLILITHRNSLLELADRVIVLDGGHVVADGPRADLQRNALNAQRDLAVSRGKHGTVTS